MPIISSSIFIYIEVNLLIWQSYPFIFMEHSVQNVLHLSCLRDAQPSIKVVLITSLAHLQLCKGPHIGRHRPASVERAGLKQVC